MICYFYLLSFYPSTYSNFPYLYLLCFLPTHKLLLPLSYQMCNTLHAAWTLALSHLLFYPVSDIWARSSQLPFESSPLTSWSRKAVAFALNIISLSSLQHSWKATFPCWSPSENKMFSYLKSYHLEVLNFILPLKTTYQRAWVT